MARRTMRWPALRPWLFVSYARTDRALADEIATALSRDGCRVWIDRNEILLGDDFVRGLQDHVDTSDGLVCLLTRHSAESSWCQAEVQRALALGLPVIIVQRDEDARLPDALERLLRDVQRAAWTDDRLPSLGDSIQRARARRRSRVARRVVGAAAAGLFLIGLAAAIVWQLNDAETARRRNDVLHGIENSQAFWSRVELDTILAPARIDPQLPPLLQRLADDATRTSAARHNAWQALTALDEQREREWRTNVAEVRWSGGHLVDALWVNVAYQRGEIRDLEVTRSRIAGVSLGRGPTADSPGLTLTHARIVDSDLWFLLVNGTQLLDVEFLDCKFRGAELDLSGHAGVRFLSSPPDPNFITPDLAIIEDSLVEQRLPLAGPDVIDLATPEQEILFDGVQFSRTYLEGHFKPEWFRNSHFEDCVFPSSLERSALERGENTIERGIWRAEDESGTP